MPITAWRPTTLFAAEGKRRRRKNGWRERHARSALKRTVVSNGALAAKPDRNKQTALKLLLSERRPCSALTRLTRAQRVPMPACRGAFSSC